MSGGFGFCPVVVMVNLLVHPVNVLFDLRCIILKLRFCVEL